MTIRQGLPLYKPSGIISSMTAHDQADAGPVTQDQLLELRFRTAIHELRQDRKMSQGELARRMVSEGWESFNQATISRIEKGTRPVRIGEAQALARIVGTTLEELLTPTTELTLLREFFECLEDVERSIRVISHAASEWAQNVSELVEAVSRVDVETVLESFAPHDRRQISAAIQQARSFIETEPDDQLRQFLFEEGQGPPSLVDRPDVLGEIGRTRTLATPRFGFR